MAPSPSTETPAGRNLAESLREATWPQHRSVERSPFLQALLRGELDRTAYCLLLRSLHEIYAALERNLAEQGAHLALAPVDAPQLFRREALEDDLAYLHGPGWHDDLPAQSAALAYARHLDDIAGTRPELLLAHAYVRYLGDLSGGQAIRRVVTRALALPEREGTQFYEFGDAASVARDFRAGIVAIDDETARHADLVDEARAAFDLHGRLFEELERSVAAA